MSRIDESSRQERADPTPNRPDHDLHVELPSRVIEFPSAEVRSTSERHTTRADVAHQERRVDSHGSFRKQSRRRRSLNRRAEPQAVRCSSREASERARRVGRVAAPRAAQRTGLEERGSGERTEREVVGRDGAASATSSTALSIGRPHRELDLVSRAMYDEGDVAMTRPFRSSARSPAGGGAARHAASRGS